jgi:hypothetical protein
MVLHSKTILFIDNDTLKFDESFIGFHCYDTDIAFQIIYNGMKTCVCFDILIEHFSYGTLDQKYYDQRKLVFKNGRSFYQF